MRRRSPRSTSPGRRASPAATTETKIFLAKARGEFVWHSHADTDDLFVVLEGRLTIQLHDGDVELGPGELIVIPRGVEHCPSGQGASILLIEPEGTPNSGGSATAAADVEL